jgi:hypothetical protein
MVKQRLNRPGIFLAAVLTLLAVAPAFGQIHIGGDFRMRFYAEQFYDTRDDRDDLYYTRLMGRLSLDAPLTKYGAFHVDFVTLGENPDIQPRTLGGTGTLIYGISQLYAQAVTSGLPPFDFVRLRVGRQHFLLGKGMTLGDSYYMMDEYDGARVDLARGMWTLGFLGAITGAEYAEGGFYPEPGSDRIYVAKLEYELRDHVLLAYYVYEAPHGDFNDNYIIGLGSSGRIVLRNLNYFAEFASQRYNTMSGLPEKGGIAYMAGVSYSWSTGRFRVLKAEIRAAGYQGDDATTEKVEIFEPFYPSWWWGDRSAYANGTIGGDYPHRGIRTEGSRVWYGRFYLSPTAIPKARLQFQYAAVRDWVNNDGVTESNDEFGIKLFYEVNANMRFQARYFRSMPNSEDTDINDSGTITRIEDRYTRQRFVLEFWVKF